MQLTSEQKRFVIERLALFDEPTEVCRKFAEEFGVEIDRRQVWKYDATKPSTAGQLKSEWIDLFHRIRSQFLERTADIAIANKAVRLKWLDETARRARTAEDGPALLSCLEQAAKETGGAYTNRRELSGPDGAPLPAAQVVLYLPDNDRDDYPTAAGSADAVPGD